MDKRLLLTLALCLVILLGWSRLSEWMGWTPPASNTDTPAASAGESPGTAPAEKPAASGEKPAEAAPPARSAVAADTEERKAELLLGKRGEPGHYRAIFSNKGGVLLELSTGNYFDQARLSAAEQEDRAHWERLVTALPGDAPRTFELRTAKSSAEFAPTPLESALWIEKRLENGIEYRLSPGQGLTFVKRFTFQGGSDRIDFELEIVNEGRVDAAGTKNFVLTAAAGVPRSSGDSYYYEPQAVAFSRSPDGDASPKTASPDHSGENRGAVLPSSAPLAFAGAFNKYFAFVLRGVDDDARSTLSGASWRAFPDGKEAPGAAPLQLATDVDLSVAVPKEGSSRTWKYAVYAGPKQREAFDAALADHKVILDHDLGYMRGLSKGLMWIMKGFHALTSSWGMAIILLTILVRALLFPINRRAQTAMARYQAKVKRIQPKIDEIKKRYKDDPSKLRAEQARVMQEGDALVPPLGGCLPPFLQIPVFFGLMSAIRIPFELRQAPFMGWIHDLSLPDRLVALDWNVLGFHVPYLNILPPLMVVMWILQQRAMPMPTDEQARMMYKMMMFMPIVMGIFLYNYAAGMSLYMITASTLAIIEQKVIKKFWPVDDTPPPKKKSGFMARLMEQAQEQQRRREAQTRKKTSARR